jgi:6-phosphofructokinase 1
MNAAIRAIVRLSALNNVRTFGFERGWEGVVENCCKELTSRSVGGILHLGGTILRTSRCPRFKEREFIETAANNLARNSIDGLAVLGGDGSFRGALALSKETDAQIVGIPATIDNDVFGTDETIGFDTAVNTAVAEVDKIRDTAISHERTFIVEVMGKKRGFLASSIGLTVGAEAILVPEVAFSTEMLFKTIERNAAKGKKSSIIIAAEGTTDIRMLAKNIEHHTRSDVRISILGYVQRGGSPTARSRALANFFANKAIDVFMKGEKNVIVGLQGEETACTDLETTCETEKPLDLDLLKLAEKLAT